MMKKLKIRDIHPEGISEEFDRLMLGDITTLLKDKSSFVDTACPACHSAHVHHVFDYQGMGYKRCQDCDTLYISPAPNELQHLDFVRNSQAMAFWRENLPESMRVSRRPMYLDRLAYAHAAWANLGITPIDILELGAGNGEFAEELALDGRAQNIVLLEPQALQLQHPRVEIITDGFEALERTRRQFDTVFAWELLEHLLEPDHFLYLVRKVLKPGAPLIISTPNERSVETRKLGTDSSNILFDHVRLYNPSSIQKLLERNGFRVIEIVTPGQLDVDRLQHYMKARPDLFAADPTLSLILQDEHTAHAFQTFLQQHLLSSHMRVIAVAEGPWCGGATPHLG